MDESWFATDPSLTADRPGQTLIGDKNYCGAECEGLLADVGLHLLRPARTGEADRPGAHLFTPLRQTIESINQTLKGQLDLERQMTFKALRNVSLCPWRMARSSPLLWCCRTSSTTALSNYSVRQAVTRKGSVSLVRLTSVHSQG